MKRQKRSPKLPSIILKADKALKIAVAKAIADHKRTGDPIYIWKNGKVVKVPASRL